MGKRAQKWPGRWVGIMRQNVVGALALLLALWAGPGHCREFNRSNLSGEAIEGFDPVTYFTGGPPRQGTRAYLYDWGGAVWRFATKADLDLFRANPQKYAPAFGGYCAYAMSKGVEADIHPFAFAVLDGRLYLFATFESRDRFVANSESRRAADANWSVLSKEQDL